MTATLTFNLPEESESHLLAVHAGVVYDKISELNDDLRAWTKHGSPLPLSSGEEAPETAMQMAHYVRVRLARIQSISNGG